MDEPEYSIKHRGVYCAVTKCRNKSGNSNESFFRFPKDILRARKWAILCRREDLLSLDPDKLNNIRICSSHFEDTDFKSPLRKRLKGDAYPTVFIFDINEECEFTFILSNEIRTEDSLVHPDAVFLKDEVSYIDSEEAGNLEEITGYYCDKDIASDIANEGGAAFLQKGASNVDLQWDADTAITKFYLKKGGPCIVSQTVIPEKLVAVNNRTPVAEKPLRESISSRLKSVLSQPPQSSRPEPIKIMEPEKQPTGMDFSVRCRTCLDQKTPQSSINLTGITNHCYIGRTFKEAITILVPDASLKDDESVCDDCAETLKRSMALIQRCLVIEENLQKCKLFPETKVTCITLDKVQNEKPVDKRSQELTNCIFVTNNVSGESHIIQLPQQLIVNSDTSSVNQVLYAQIEISEPNKPCDSRDPLDPECSDEVINDSLTEVDHDYSVKLESRNDEIIKIEDKWGRSASIVAHDRIISLEPVNEFASQKMVASLTMNQVNLLDLSSNEAKRKRYLLVGTNMALKCRECGKSLKYQKDHVCRRKLPKKYKPMEKCIMCNKDVCITSMDLHLRAHRRKEERQRERQKLKEAAVKTFICKTCEERFISKEEYETHLVFHPPYVCEQCGKRFVKNVSLKAHLITHNDPNTYICECCGRGFKDRCTLRVHQMAHNEKTANESHKCPLCPKVFRAKRFVDRHIKKTHQKVYQIQCTLCGKLFAGQSHLNQHTRLVHERVKPFQCKVCLKTFGRTDYLRRHMLRHANESAVKIARTRRRKEDKYRRGRTRKFDFQVLEIDGVLAPCKFCGKYFPDVVRLKRHMETHVIRYNCQFCPLTFSSKAICKRHEKSHDGGKVTFYRCDVCWKRFKSREVRDEHTKCHNKPRYACDLCGRPFNRLYLLNHHKLMDHNYLLDEMSDEQGEYESLPMKMEQEEGVYENLLEVNRAVETIHMPNLF